MDPSRAKAAARRRGAWLAALLLPGCTAGAWRDRAHDLAEVFEASGSVGPGMAAHVRVTELAQIGAGSFDGASAGLLEGRFAAAREQRSELGVSLLHTYDYRRESKQLLDVRHPHWGDPGYDPYPLSWQLESDRGDLDVGFGLHLAYIGFGATLRVGELLDFLAGCVGLDPLRDDAYGLAVDDLRRRACSRDPAIRAAAFDALLRRGEPIHGYAIYTAGEVTPSYQRRALDEVRAELDAASRTE